MIKHFSTFGLIQQALIHAAPQKVQLRLTESAFEPEQESVIVIRGIVQPVLIREQGAKDGAELQELVPVLVGSCQAAHLQAKDDPDVVEADFGQHVLKPEPSHCTLAAQALIFIDHLHTILGPAQEPGTIHQRVLPIRRLAVLENLLRRRLTDIDDGFTL